MNKFIVKPNKTIEEITRLNKKPKEWLIDESFADLQRRNATFEELQAWLAIPQSVGCMTATHKHQGVLIDGSFYTSRNDCRKDAVQILKHKINKNTT